MLEYRNDDMFATDDSVALVNPVNCLGQSGAGLALEIRRRFPAAHQRFEYAARQGLVAPGQIFPTFVPPRTIFHFPTKRDWRDPSRLEDIEAGLHSLARHLITLAIPAVAIPALGCGLGGLAWDDVRPLIAAMAESVDPRCLIYSPR